MNIRSGFKSTGIHDSNSPSELKVNRKAISQKMFTPKSLKAYIEYKRKQKESDTAIPESEDGDRVMPGPSNQSTNLIEEEPESPEANDESDNTMQPDEPDDQSVTFQNLLLETMRPAEVQNKPITRRKIASEAEILTGRDLPILPNTEDIPETIKKKPKVPNKKKKKDPQSSSSESDCEISSDITESGDDTTNSEESDDVVDPIISRDFQVGDFALVSFPMKKSVTYYMGQIEEKTTNLIKLSL